MCSPAHTAKQDFTQTTPVNLGTNVLWTRPEFEVLAPKDLEASRSGNAPNLVWRKAKVMVFCFPEVDVP